MTTVMFDKDRVDYKREHTTSAFSEERPKNYRSPSENQDEYRFEDEEDSDSFSTHAKREGRLFENNQICQPQSGKM